MKNDLRDAQICELYKSGVAMAEIANVVGLRKQRIHQILKRNDLGKKDRPVDKSTREEFLGVNVSEDDKVALRQEAERRGISMSALTAELITDMLAGLPK